MEIMYSAVNQSTTFKYNYDNLHETILSFYSELTALQKELIGYLECELNDNEKKEMEDLKQFIQEYECAIFELEDINFINNLHDQKTDWFFLVDIENQNEEIEKIRILLKLKDF
ncbi:hypothetical protein [Alteromonas flava]|uniref:hypothetical protein n=1 Tax=Alteromonas flava TaxID=2048003 RepID=UPI000C2856C4|nr:hypothetical protein [Alteromonas flava]